ncbi:ribonuclease T2 family protein [Pararhizobium arenae]|uniref:ribonuclease T2 family protein n=1 Tax=Pararhizobium arenae TaxID=1856850 RepID=UPI0018E96398
MAALRTLALLFGLTIITLALTACGDSGNDNAQGSQKPPTPIASTGATKTAETAKTTLPLGSGFDFYVLSLSWSPSWCGDNDPQGKTMQCDAHRNHGLIVHGLWPQNESGYPEFCRSRDPDRVPEALGRQLFDIMPSMGLIGHEWRKHGTCSGLSQKDYFATLRAAWQKLALPPELTSGARSSKASPQEIEADLIAANPGLTAGAIAVTCSANQLDEIRICMDTDLSFRACPEVDRRSCRARALTLPAL